MQGAGGTLFQLIVPLAFVVYFWRRGDRHAASVPLWWVGQNCWNIARYVADAHAIFINDQWRICFRFVDGDAFEVEVCDYH